MGSIQNSAVERTFRTYPADVRPLLLALRQLILDTARETDDVGELQETLKWGQPSYIAKGGSTIRIGFNTSMPDHYAMYFHCATKLIDTFKELYPKQFRFEGNRAIVFNKETKPAVEELKHCVTLALTYHKVKHLPLLGA